MTYRGRPEGRGVAYVKAGILPCESFAAVRCVNEHCESDHHNNLDPRLVGTKEPLGYMVPNKLGEACQNCLDNLRECDKKQRDADDRDPCSECRNFGGTKCKCTLSKECSYNNVVYDKLLSRGHVHDYTLTPPCDRVGGPMPPHRVKKGWVGQTKEKLLAKPDSLPSGVRDCLRAFVVVPREHLQRLSRESWPDSDQLWLMPATIWYEPTPLPPLAISKPPRKAIGGKVEYTTFVWDTGQWRHVYENGEIQPCSLPPPTFPRPQPDPTAGKVMHTTFIWGTGQWRHVYENNTLVTFPHQRRSVLTEVDVTRRCGLDSDNSEPDSDYDD
ncbi:hypothetical protein KCU65_g9777, partial [Aureobasidium melanogenum]